MQGMQEMYVSSLGWDDTLELEMATHSNVFAWKIPWTEKAGKLQSMGLQRLDTTEQCAQSLYTYCLHEALGKT